MQLNIFDIVREVSRCVRHVDIEQRSAKIAHRLAELAREHSLSKAQEVEFVKTLQDWGIIRA
jgi:hypothetical protein